MMIRRVTSTTMDDDTDDGQIGLDDGRADARNIRDLREATTSEQKEDILTNRPLLSWSQFRFMWRVVNTLFAGGPPSMMTRLQRLTCRRVPLD